jgi:hypothetical protein
MAIIRDINDSGLEAIALDDVCNLCGSALDFPIVFWACPSTAIKCKTLMLHPSCVRPFCIRIERDARELVDGRDNADAWLKNQK